MVNKTVGTLEALVASSCASTSMWWPRPLVTTLGPQSPSAILWRGYIGWHWAVLL